MLIKKHLEDLKLMSVLEGSLVSAIKDLEALLKKYSEYQNLRIDFNDSPNDYCEIWLIGDREETAEEKTTREEQELKKINSDKEYRRGIYENLKKEFGQ